jgi:hypothetical protein
MLSRLVVAASRRGGARFATRRFGLCRSGVGIRDSEGCLILFFHAFR